MTWQLIETAPKDGTKILVGWPGIINMGRFDPAEEEWIPINRTTRFYPDAPTHWMPLPDPPPSM